MTFFDAITLWISIKTAICATLLASIVGFFAAAYISSREGSWSARRFAVIDGILIAPMILPPTVIGFALLILLGANSPLGQLWEKIFGNPLVFSWPATVVAASTVALPLMYRTTRAALLQVDRQLIATAITLTESRTRIYSKVILPAAWPGVLAGILLAFARSLGEFGATLMLAGSIPGKTRTIPMTIYYAVESGQYAEAMFWSLLIMILSLTVIFVAESRLTPKAQGRPRKAWVPSSPSAASEGLALWLSKRFHNFTLDFQLQTNSRRVAILGASGSGKSSFLRCLAGLDQPDQGWIQVDGRCWVDTQKKISLVPKKRKVGLLLQNYALFPHLSVRENIAFGAQGLSSEAVDQWLQKIGLTSYAEHKATQLSGGQQQRVALARALAAEPQLLLLDEPFTALDAYLRDRLEQQLIADLYRFPGRMFLVTHNVDEAWRLCDEVVILQEGRIIRQGPKAEVFENPGTVAAAQLTGCKNLAEVSARRASKVYIEAWNCELELPANAANCEAVGIRANHIKLSGEGPEEPNTFVCWLARISEAPHRLTFFLKLNSMPEDALDAVIQVSLSRDRAEELQARPQPWFITFPTQRILVLRKF